MFSKGNRLSLSLSLSLSLFSPSLSPFLSSRSQVDDDASAFSDAGAKQSASGFLHLQNNFTQIRTLPKTCKHSGRRPVVGVLTFSVVCWSMTIYKESASTTAGPSEGERKREREREASGFRVQGPSEFPRHMRTHVVAGLQLLHVLLLAHPGPVSTTIDHSLPSESPLRLLTDFVAQSPAHLSTRRRPAHQMDLFPQPTQQQIWTDSVQKHF